MRARSKIRRRRRAKSWSPQTYLAHEKLEPMKMIDMEKDFKDYDPFDIGAMGEFDVDVLVEQYAGRDEASGDLSGVARRLLLCRQSRKADKSAPIGVLYVSRWSSAAKAAEFAAVYAKSLAQRYQKRQALGADGKVAEDAPPGGFLANLARTARLADGRGSGSD